jgi:aldose 1-epimerase
MTGIEQSIFGQLGADAVHRYALKNKAGAVLEVTNYGATLTGLHVPDRFGRLADVVLGFDDVQGYVDHGAYFGATVGRVANRIRDGVFQLEGKRYEVAVNDPPHHLHGGRKGWSQGLWAATPHDTPRGPSLELRYTSADGEEGYPGRVEASTFYTLTHENVLIVEMRARTDRTTIINMAHHTYWNLGGHTAPNVLDHELVIDAEFYTPGDPIVPIGDLARVANTPFDFRGPKLIWRRSAMSRSGTITTGWSTACPARCARWRAFGIRRRAASSRWRLMRRVCSSIRATT